MFVWKALGKLLLGDEEKRDLVSLPTGSLWRRRSERQHSHKEVVERTLMYPRASLTLRRTGEGREAKGGTAKGTMPFSFELLVQERRDDEKGADKKTKSRAALLTFPLNRQLDFERIHDDTGGVSFFWTAAGDKDDLRYEFVYEEKTAVHGETSDKSVEATKRELEAASSGADPSSLTATVEMFHLMVAQCWWEQREQRPFSEAPDEEIRSLVAVHHTIVRDAAKAEEMVITFTSAPALWYVFDGNTGMFVPKQAGPVRARILERAGRGKKKGLSASDSAVASNFSLQIIDELDEQQLHRQVIDPDATLHTDRKNFSFIWCYFPPMESAATAGNAAWTYSLRFPDAPSVMALSNGVGQAIYEILNQAKVAEEDKDYLLGSLCVGSDGSSDSDYDDNEADRSDTDSAADRSEEESSTDEDESPTVTRSGQTSTARNQHLVVGYKHDRSFVSRGSALSIFKHTPDDQLELVTEIDQVRSNDGRHLLASPRQMMLHEEDRSLLLVDAQDPSTIHRMDVEYGRVVEEWQATGSSGEGANPSLSAILPSRKYAQLTGEPTLIGLTDRSLFRLDPRLPGPVKRVQDESKEYVLKNGFSCGATTGAGELAVGSTRGEIRLFDRLDRRAKTLLPGFGDPILALDSTESGRWLVATCKTYLLLICTEHPGQEDLLGFHRSLGANKPTPRRLQLRPEHVAFLGGPVSFTPARFSTGQSEERSIITSTGPYVITWNLRRVKAGHLYDYQIRKYEDTVVADNFRYGQDRSIVVTLPHHVTMLSKRSLSTPSATLTKGRGGERGSRRSSQGRKGEGRQHDQELPISIENLDIMDE